MDISKLNQRIQIQKAILKTDEVGNVIQQWQDFYSCFRSVYKELHADHETRAADNK